MMDDDKPFVPGSLPVVPEQTPQTRPNEFVGRDLTARQVPSLPPPATTKPTDAEFYLPNSSGMPNAMFLQRHFVKEGRLTEEQALFILQRATELLKREPNMVDVKSPVTICGDIHGQYYDLMKLFEVGGGLQNNTYLFLGDYVDRGCFGIECLLLLYALKLNYPNNFVLLRGNHECRHLTEYFTFKRECLHKYSPQVYEACIRSFCALPVAARVDKHFFCVHGGISPLLNTLDDIRQMNRFEEPGSNGLLCDLLWADPIANFGHENEPSAAHGPGLPPGTQWVHNQARGCSYYYTYEAACKFLDRNDLLGIIRGHEAQDAGYTMHRKTPSNKFPSVITIFSAPNYLDVYHNRAAVLKYQNKNVTIRQFNSSSHPYWLPNFMDAFTWSLPFVGAKITEMLLAILSICSEEELEENEIDGDEDSRALAEADQRRQQIKSKIMAVGKMQRVFQILREEAEQASELEDVEDPTGMQDVHARVGLDSLGVHGTVVTRNIHSFDDARRSDMLNERLPQFKPPEETGNGSPTSIFPTPSMRTPHRKGSGEGDGAQQMEYLIKTALEKEGDESGVVERLAEKIASSRKPTGRPRALKRYETT